MIVNLAHGNELRSGLKPHGGHTASCICICLTHARLSVWIESTRNYRGSEWRNPERAEPAHKPKTAQAGSLRLRVTPRELRQMWPLLSGPRFHCRDPAYAYGNQLLHMSASSHI